MGIRNNPKRFLRLMLCISLTLTFHLLPLTLHAQEGDFLHRSEMTFCGGAMNYIGDLNNQSAFGTPHTAGTVGLRCRVDSRWAVRFEASMGRISSEDYLEWRNLSFRSDIIEAAALAEFNFWSYGNGATDRNWVFYLWGGIGAFHFNPMASITEFDGSETWVELQPLRTEGQGSLEYPSRRPYSLTQLTMPFGIGIKGRINKHLTYSLEYGFRKTWTDYLDDVSTTYVGSDLLLQNSTDGQMAATLADRSATPNAVGIKRGDDSLNDWYAYLRVGIGLRLETILGWTRSKRCKL